eukprot:CFRG2809T1
MMDTIKKTTSFLRFSSKSPRKFAIMQNDQGVIVDMYIPRKCSATNRIIGAKDHASTQLNIASVDESGVYNGKFTTYALSGFVRALGEADSSVNRLASDDKIVSNM